MTIKDKKIVLIIKPTPSVTWKLKRAHYKASKNKSRIVEFLRQCDSGDEHSKKPA
jgi:hypothetical protein